MAKPLGPPIVLVEREFRNRIARIGLELEGIWTPGGLPPKTIPQRDGSLQEFADEYTIRTGVPVEVHGLGMGAGYAYCGEITSAPMKIEEVEPWLRTFYPQEANHVKCGMHIHMSFASALLYQRTMDPRLGGTVVEYVKKWTEANLPANHHIWPRLRNENIYCQHVYDAELQAQNRGRMGDGRDHYDQRRPGHRYTVINYCYQAHQTIECRLLPMMPTVDLAISAVKEVLRVVNGFLVTTAVREKKRLITVCDDGAPVQETRRIYV
jgi:hypothetical protein